MDGLVLTLVTFLPAAGAVVMAFFPRNDRLIRWAALIISLLTFVIALHLPGHTPEHLGLLVSDRVRTVEPWFVVTGHTLMVGDMGRTELATSAEEGASW